MLKCSKASGGVSLHSILFSSDKIKFIKIKINFPFPDCWKISSVVPVFNNVGERSTAKSYHPVSLLSVVSKVFEKHVNNRIVGHLEKLGLFSDFQYGFRSSWSTANLLIVVSDRIAMAFNRSGATWVPHTWYIQGFWQGLAFWSTSQT